MNGPMNDFNMNWSNFFMTHMVGHPAGSIGPLPLRGPLPLAGGGKMPIPPIRLLLLI